MNTNATRSQCIDAETLAAWADDGLSAQEAARVELHLSNCERCQEVLAAFSRSEPAAAAVIPFWARRPVRWSAGTLAAAAAVILMVWSGRAPAELQQESTMARSEAAGAASSDFAAAAPVPARPGADERVDDLKKAAAPETQTPAAGTQRGAAPQPQTAAEEAARQALPQPTVSATPPPVPAAPPPPPGQRLGSRAAQAPPPPSEPPLVVTPAEARRPVGGAAVGRAVAAEPAAELKDEAERDAWRLAAVEIVAPSATALEARRFDTSQAGARAARGGRGGGGRATAEGSAVPVRWRILGGMLVERSVDNGVTWTPATLGAAPAQAGDQERFALTQQEIILTGGAAASQTVCWLVGRNGAVFLSTDGVTFRRVTSPGQVDIKSVEAVDAEHATITTIDGRTFATADAGLTWTAR